jgi:hypothetical protein
MRTDDRMHDVVIKDNPLHMGKIISGGQTGVDRAALDVALELDIPCGGWCPKGRKAEDGPIDTHYPLQETGSVRYPIRTERNVRDSDGTLILAWGKPSGGTALTIELAKKMKKPFCIIDLSMEADSEAVREWVKANGIRILNVAGPPESSVHGVYDQAVKFLRSVLNRP